MALLGRVVAFLRVGWGCGGREQIAGIYGILEGLQGSQQASLRQLLLFPFDRFWAISSHPDLYLTPGSR